MGVLVYGYNAPVSFTITVTGGTGTLPDTPVNGKGMQIGVTAPSDEAEYDLEVVDCDGFIKVHGDGLVGNTTIENDTKYWGNHVFNITNASEDGDYNIRIWYE